jgi:hypothetical protein
MVYYYLLLAYIVIMISTCEYGYNYINNTNMYKETYVERRIYMCSRFSSAKKGEPERHHGSTSWTGDIKGQ